MFRPIIQRSLSTLLLAVFLVFLSPGEAIHAFFDHHDTKHAQEPKGVSFDTPHTHCSFWHFDSQAFESSKITNTDFIFSAFAGEQIRFVKSFTRTVTIFVDGRGPPTC